ncbi:hypothetical protein PRIC2_003130 [Phytophthora ramorum]
MATEPLLLAARELARGSMASLLADVEVAASAASAAHLAVLFRSRTEPNRVRLGVFQLDEQQAPELVDLLPRGGDSDAFQAENNKWTLVWSPDLKFLVVSGQIAGSEGQPEGVLWLFARPEWLAPGGATGPALLLRVDPAMHLTEKHWSPATGIVNVFFPSQSGSKVFVLGDDGVWLSVDVQLAKLALVAMEQTATEDKAGIFSIKVMKKLSEWHAGVTAACYEPRSSTLVVTGGVRDPSAELVEKQACSLSVWKVASDKDSKDVAELLDVTMVLKGTKEQLGEAANSDEQSDLVSTTPEDTGGLLSSVFAPFKMMVGAETKETRVMRGSIRHLALSPNGNFVSMVDDLGRIAIRQIDACADVLEWQKIEDVSTGLLASSQSISTKQIEWLASDLMALVLTDSSVIYSRFIPHSDDGTDESLSPSGRLILTPAKYHRPALDGHSNIAQVLTLAAKESPSGDDHSSAFTTCEIIATGSVWVANEVRSLAVEPFLELLMSAQKFEDALATVALYETRDDGIAANDIHRRIWTQYQDQAARLLQDNDEVSATRYLEFQDLVFLSSRPRGLLQRGERDEFADTLDHLRAMSDKQWVLGECLHLIADDSSASMTKILDLAWDAWLSLNDDNEGATARSQEKVDLQRYRYRLETLRLVLCEEEGLSATSMAGDQLFDGMAYVLFRSSPVAATAKQFAREGRVGALTVLFHRHAWNLMPHWFDILELLPPCVSPSTYSHLLPAIAAQIEDDGQFFTLRMLDNVATEADDENETATPVIFLPENQLQDLTDEELAEFEEFTQASREERNAAYAAWYTKRILELDTRYGQLTFAYDLSSLATKCISGWSSQEAKRQLEEFFLCTERLYRCVYPLHLSACCLLPLNEWSALSMQEQAMVVVGCDEKEIIGDVASIIDRLDVVFVSQRRDRTYSLDDMFSWLAQSISSKSSLASLTLVAQLVQRSNPSIGRTNRWIQSDARLIETALDVVYSVDASDIVGEKAPSVSEDVYIQRHLAVVEQLWIIFQSLPVRKENDPPEIAQLQVAVDEMEDLMVTMDVLSKYGVVSSPSGLKYRMLASSDVGIGSDTSAGLLEQMCEFALSGECSDDEKNVDGGQWIEVLQDAVKLKEHAFGERLTQEMILDVILKHLLAPDRAYVDAAQNLVNHWIASDVEAVDHVLDELFMAIRAKLDSVTGFCEDASSNCAHEAAWRCIGIVRHLLSLPLWDEGDRAASNVKQHYEDILELETDRAHACELLDLLTYGAVKLSPAELRSGRGDDEEDENVRLDAVCQIFVSNPSNYKTSMRAREWLTQHPYGKSGLAGGETTTDVWNEPLAAVMHLAKLLRVDSQKLEIWMKGAYAALYCMDYDVAYDLTMQIIDEIPADADTVAASGSSDKLTLLHVVSLVLDLVSASSFGSWGKKYKLCRALFSSANASSLDLFAHQVTDLVLSWLERIEAIQALMVELGLSDTDLEQRRLVGGKHSASSAEVVLLNELKVVVDLLHEEKNDRQFLLRLLQRGFQLAQVMSTNEVAGLENHESVLTFLQQMVQLCVQEAMELTATPIANASGEWQQFIELGFSYLIQWNDLCADDKRFEAFCTDEIISSVFAEQPETSTASSSNETVQTSEVVGRRLHHFFLLQVAQAKEEITASDTEALQIRRKRLETLSSSYEAARRTISPLVDSHNGSLENVASPVDERGEPRLLMSEQRYQIFLKLSQQCQERLLSQKKSQELEKMSAFFNTELDLELFSQDESYRNEKIMLLATKKDHFQVSRQFASKYGIDEYECVLAYLKHALLFPSDSTRMGRRDQLDQAFHIEQVDVLEEALQRPSTFGDFLLGNGPTGEPSLYEELDGTDHVGILLVLRMVLECSKRINQESAGSASPLDGSLFPLSKRSTDRVTLLFMCLKKLKDIGDSMGDVDSVDLKLIGAASTTTELLTPLASSRTDPQIMVATRQAAVEAARPLLSGKTIKFVTKILRKFHRVTASSMVMIYINDLLTGIWREHGATGSSAGALSADLAAYAYESCVPCLSVLSNEHLMLFHHLFLNGSSGKPTPALVTHLNLVEEFYGQPLGGLQHFGALLTPQKRVELVADTLTLFQTKYNSWQNTGPRSNVSSASSTSSSSSTSWDPAQHQRKEHECQYLEREMAENVCYLLLGEIKQHGLTFDAQSLEPVISDLQAWFAMDLLRQPANEEEELQDEELRRSVLLNLSQRVASVDLATLIMELVLCAGGNNAREDVIDAIAENYQVAVDNLVGRCMGGEDDGTKPSAPWVERLAWTWVTGSSATNSSQMTELGGYLRVTLSVQRDEKSRAIYQRAITLLTQSPSTILKEIGLIRLAEVQTPADEREATNVSLVAVVRETVLSVWAQLTTLREKQQKWADAAVLNHILLTSDSKTSLDPDVAKWHFGLCVKAVWSALLAKHEMGQSEYAPPVLQVDSYDIPHYFTGIFEKLLVFLEVCSSEDDPKALRFAEEATVALSNLLVRYDDIRTGTEGAAERSASGWQHEQKRAVQARIRAQFQVDTTTEMRVSPQKVEDATSWSALFARGVWGARLLSWYTTHAYAELSGEKEATEAVILVHWEANNIELAVQLLLMCPFDSLREKYTDRALSGVRQLPQESSSWPAVMELVLLRFDVAVLLQHGLHSSVVAFLLRDSNSRTPSALWTSSGDYVVCALVTWGEFAAAGRLTCALRHAHPLLWDVENARLLLANYLRSLASSPVKSRDSEIAHLKRQVHVQTSSSFASAIM